MEFLNIIGSVNIKPDWANISGSVLKAGTPLSITGVVANNANAIGLLAGEAHKGDGEVNVVYAGLVDIGEVERSYGDSLADDCKAALKGITLVSASGAATVSSGLPDYSEASDGDVLSIESGVPSWVTPDNALILTIGNGGSPTGVTNDEIAAAAAAGRLIFTKWEGFFSGPYYAPARVALKNNGQLSAVASYGICVYGGECWVGTVSYATSGSSGSWSATETQLALYSDLNGGAVDGDVGEEP